MPGQLGVALADPYTGARHIAEDAVARVLLDHHADHHAACPAAMRDSSMVMTSS